ncbi:DUF4145 domain-containing protein [Smaragdicoccus niigatensis]|uniref:DUF4145 domain-containing protein n=1 Tax=Smaragdicoccus niigatensis TaxID=359359 RepID=UPI00037485CE|nr:DUF4145 domain-containing protein [Smaragdicoccus niigatensis]
MERADTSFVWAPTAGQTKPYPHAPSHIGDAATEGYECLARNHYRAAIMLTRAVIEATAKHKGIANGNLFQKIDALRDIGVIRAHICDGAHGIRKLGNDMAHGDFTDPITKEDATAAITMMGVILDEVYTAHSIISTVTASADQRKQVLHTGG